MAPLVALLLTGLGPQAPEIGQEVSTLEGAIEEHEPLLAGMRAGDDFLVPGSDRYRIHARYLGRTREMPEPRRQFLRKWMASFQKPSAFAELYEREILIAEGSREYWVPIQMLLLPVIEDEAERGEQVTLDVVFIGGRVPDWMFLVDAFETVEHRGRGT